MVEKRQEQLEVENILKNKNVNDATEEDFMKVKEYWNDSGESYVDYISRNLYSVTSNMQSINKWIANKASYNPPTSQDYTQDINISPRLPELSDLKKYLSRPSVYQKQLRDISQYLQNTIMQYQRTTDYLTKILAMNSDLRSLDVPENKEEIETWKNSYRRCKDFLKNFNARYQFSLVTQKIAEEGGFFAYLQEKEHFATLIEIPSDWCYITGRWDLGWTYAIDLTYYDQLIGIVEVTPELSSY